MFASVRDYALKMILALKMRLYIYIYIYIYVYVYIYTHTHTHTYTDFSKLNTYLIDLYILFWNLLYAQ